MEGKRKCSEDLSESVEENFEDLLEENVQVVFEELESLVEDLENSNGEKDEEALSVLIELIAKIRILRRKLIGQSTK